MHELSNLVKFRNDLAEQVDELTLTADIEQRVEILNRIKNINPNVPIAGVFDQYLYEYKELDNRNQMIIDSINVEITAINQRIDDLAKQLFDTDTNRSLFEESRIPQTMSVNKEQFEIIDIQMGSYCDWRYPSLILYPRDKKWISSSIVASDPLYIVHNNSILGNDHDSILKLIEDFSDVYKSRLRIYSVDSNNYSILPQNQFGFILLLDWLTYLSIDRFSEYFQQIYKLLKPGGSCMFSYNNCDIPGSARLAELNIASYATTKMVKQLVHRAGFKIHRVEDLPTGDAFLTHISWMEIQKPGTLTTVKAHQALAQIITK
jgi:SAM-dependent methyltransferase